MWTDIARTPEEAKANPLTQINLKKNGASELVGIQLVFARTGIESPFFKVKGERRALNDPAETGTDNVGSDPGNTDLIEP